MALVASCANRSDLLEVGARLHACPSTPLSPMPRLVHLSAPACHALLCLCLLMATRGPQGHLSSHLARRRTRDRNIQQPLCYASYASMQPPSSARTRRRATQIHRECSRATTCYKFSATFYKVESWHDLCTHTGRPHEGHTTTPALGRADAQHISPEGPAGSHLDMALSQKTFCRESR